MLCGSGKKRSTMLDKNTSLGWLVVAIVMILALSIFGVIIAGQKFNIGPLAPTNTPTPTVTPRPTLGPTPTPLLTTIPEAGYRILYSGRCESDILTDNKMTGQPCLFVHYLSTGLNEGEATTLILLMIAMANDEAKNGRTGYVYMMRVADTLDNDGNLVLAIREVYRMAVGDPTYNTESAGLIERNEALELPEWVQVPQ